MRVSTDLTGLCVHSLIRASARRGPYPGQQVDLHSMNETQFHLAADAMLGALYDTLEEADAEGRLDVEYQGGIITLTLSSNKQIVVSKHTASRQIWLSSPVSGGLHFSHEGGRWSLADGRTLPAVLADEIRQIAHIEMTFQ